MKVKIKKPAYSLVLCDLSAAEVRTAINGACLWRKDYSMADVYKEVIYNKEVDSNKIELYPYELLETPTGKKSASLLNVGDAIIDINGNSYIIKSKEYSKDFILITY